MQAVVLCAGKSSRFFPFTNRHKSLVTLCGKPLLSYTLNALAGCGIRDIIVVVGPPESGKDELQEFLGDGSSFGFDQVHYVEEPRQVGMGRAVQVAGQYVQDTFLVINPYHVTIGSLLPKLINGLPTSDGVVAMATTNHPERYGMLEIVANNEVKNILVKPSIHETPSDKRLLGTYLLPKDFLPYLDHYEPAQDHFEKALSSFSSDKKLQAILYEEDTFTLKYPWHLFPIWHYLLDTIPTYIHPSAQIASSAVIDGKVIIEEGARILDYAVIKGPCFIGKHATIGTHTLVRAYSCIEEGASIGCFTEIRNSRIGIGTSIHSGFVGDSIIGNETRIGAGFCTANRRLDRGIIKVSVNDDRIASETSRLGVLVGDHSKIGIKVSTMPGTVIAPEMVINAGAIVK
jgi:bifunctional UDP-N-acetylglucosamine pyrophosphorylase/glucosamine-1-phosphate N-acetyltransferase